MIDISSLYLDKAAESLAGAESEAVNGRYNNCANRSYYACLQAAIAALLRAGVRPPGPSGEWSHSFVHAQFEGQLINRRKLYATDLRNILQLNYVLRRVADYEDDQVSQIQASRAARRARTFVQAIQAGGDRR